MSSILHIPAPEIILDDFDFSPDPPKSTKEKRLEDMGRMPKEDMPDLLVWTLEKRVNLGPDRPFRLDNHPYLEDIYREAAKEIALMKASQMGASEWLVSYALHACDQRRANVLYIFPTETHVSDFSTARLGPAIEASAYLSRIIVDASGSGGLRGSDKVALKRIRDRFLYFRGSKVQPDGKAPQLKSVDADILIYDEVDELDPRAPAIAGKRLGHAPEDLGNTLWVSTPTYPGVGIHERYLESDQRQWFVTCPHCGEKQPMEIDQVVMEWDDVGRPVEWHGREEGRAWVACSHCEGELDRLAMGEWVAKHPGKAMAGYHLTKLFSAQTPVLQVVNDLDTVDPDKLREAHNQHLGLPFTPRGGSLDAERLDACRRAYGHGPDVFKTCYMGIDQSPRICHIVVRTLPDFETGETKQLYAGEATWEHLPNLIKIYRPRVIVIDAMPETTKARELQDMYTRNMVWLAYYPNFAQGSKREEPAVWNPRETTVLLDRTRILDEMFAGFYGMTSTLPLNARSIRDYYKQMISSIRVTAADNSGALVTRYREVGADHYCLVAGTLIETEQGSVPVEKILPGMRVLTRQGYKTVTVSGKTSPSSSVRDYCFSNGQVLRATPNHPVFIRGKGYIPLDSVVYGDIIETCQMSKLSPIEGSHFAAIQTVSGGRTESTLHLADHRERKDLNDFIRLYGKMHMGLSRPSITSTTKTRILSTMIWKTWNVCQKASIDQTILNPIWQKRIDKKFLMRWIRYVTCLKHGIRQMLEKNFTADWHRIYGQLKERISCVLTAEILLSLFEHKEILRFATAQRLVIPPTVEKAERTTRKEYVPTVETSTLPANSLKENAAPRSAPNDIVSFIRSEPRGTWPVYNLSVEEAEEYYANGILLHNCHAEVYALAASKCRHGQGWTEGSS